MIWFKSLSPEHEKRTKTIIYIFDSSYCLGNIIAFFARMAAGYAIESIDPGKDFSMREVYGLDPALSK